MIIIIVPTYLSDFIKGKEGGSPARLPPLVFTLL